jgi:hypothetical protein
MELHGFYDVSTWVYAAAVYVRLVDMTSSIDVYLITSNSKVAPIKTTSIPIFELYGAVFLVKLVRHLKKLPLFDRPQLYLSTDRQIVLAWLNKHPSHWKTFVTNRISLIQTELPLATWAHVTTKKIPADLATRGVWPCELVNSDF